MPRRAWAVVRASQSDSAAVRKLDIAIVDKEGQVALQLSGFSTRAVQDSEPVGASQTVLAVPEWKVQAVTACALQEGPYSAHWVILCEVEAEFGFEADMAPARCIRLKADEYSLEARYSSYAAQLLKQLQEMVSNGLRSAVLVQLVVPLSEVVLQGLSGLLRSAQREYPLLAGQVVVVESKAALAKRLEAEASAGVAVVRYSSAGREVLSFREWESSSASDELLPWRAGGVYWITGGLGGLGRVFAQAIAQQVKAAVVVLSGRQRELGPKEEAFIEGLKEQGLRVDYRAVEVSEAGAMRELAQEIVAQYGRLNGVIHSAGVLNDGLLVNKSPEQLEQVLRPKVRGLVALDEATHDMGLEWLVLCSSMTSVVGNVGQSDYGAANGFMDSYAQYRQGLVEVGQRQGRTVSVSWPLWAEGRMQIEARTIARLRKAIGLEPLPSRAGVDALSQVLSQPASHVVVLHGERKRLLAYLRSASEAPALPQLTPVAVISQEEGLQEAAERYLARLVAGSLKLPVERIDAQAPLEQYGIDSLMVVALTRELEGTFGPLPATLFFEYQSLAAVTQYFLEYHTGVLADLLGKQNQAQLPNGDLPSEAAVPAPLGRRRRRRGLGVPAPASALTRGPLDIAIVGLSGRYPKAKTVAEYWANLIQGVDCITEIPLERWDWRDYFDSHKGREGKSYSKWGGFLEGVDRFDPLFFNISPREAQLMDPQERLFLQCAYSAIEDAGYTRESFGASAGSNGWLRQVGVFVGVMYEEYQLYGAQAQRQGVGIALAGSASSIANRVSYYCNFQGPSLAVDTMCSSSLTAIHLACQSLRQVGCRVAIAGGVNVTIHPNKYLILSQGQFASSQGRCMSFGEGGDGFVPGEGVGAVVLKPLQEAIADGDHIYGVIKGSAINHGGKTNGYTVPNPKAQGEVISQALEESGIHPRVISYVEAHGTGTALGDPIEIAGLSQAFGAQTQETQYCAIGSAKSNVGHCESAAGIAGLTKVLLQMQHGRLVKSLHSEKLNPHIDFSCTPFVVQREFGDWLRPVLLLDGHQREYPRSAGISSFGAGGSNAHLIVEEYVAPAREATAIRGPVAVVLSARSQERLQVQVQQLLAYLDEHEVNLADLAYTLQVGREALGVRLALVASSVEELKRKLAHVSQNKPSLEEVYRGEVKRNQEMLAVFRADEELQEAISKWVARGKVGKLAELWVQGLVVDWAALYDESKPQRLSLPTYPFAQERYWCASSRYCVETGTFNDKLFGWDWQVGHGVMCLVESLGLNG